MEWQFYVTLAACFLVGLFWVYEVHTNPIPRRSPCASHSMWRCYNTYVTPLAFAVWGGFLYAAFFGWLDIAFRNI